MSYRFTLLLLPLLITGCATTSITPVIKEKPVQPYRTIMTLVVRSRTMDFRQFDADTYQNHIEDKFNNLVNIEYRQQLERSLQRNLSAKNSKVLASSALFEVNERIAYDDFVATLHDRDIEAILLINVFGYWYTESDYYDPDTGLSLLPCRHAKRPSLLDGKEHRQRHFRRLRYAQQPPGA